MKPQIVSDTQAVRDYIKDVSVVLKSAYLQYRVQPGDIELVVWARSMLIHKVSVEQFNQAMIYWQATQKFFPQPVEIAEIVRGENAGNRGLRALDTLRDLIRKIGPYMTPPIEDPVLVQTIEDFGGWVRMNEECDDSESFKIRFSIAYRNNQRSTPTVGGFDHFAIGVDDADEPQSALSFESGPKG